MKNLALVLSLSAASLAAMAMQPKEKAEPQPKVITPGAASTDAPSDAIVLFDGTSLDAWQLPDGKPAGWKLDTPAAKGAGMTMAGGSIITKKNFGSCQIHLEFATPTNPTGSGQDRGNSGVYLQGRYEVQVLDSFKSETYPDGQCAAVYKQHAPLVNACREPGQWQTYDIIFTAPRFSADGKLQSPAYLTVLHNGVLVQNHFPLEGTTAWDRPPQYTAHAAKEPLVLQNHGNPVRYRNIWLREL